MKLFSRALTVQPAACYTHARAPALTTSAAHGRTLPKVYDQLRDLAADYLRRERPGHTLQPTALVHEAYLRLLGQWEIDWETAPRSSALPRR